MTTPLFVTNWGSRVATLTTNGGGLATTLNGTGMSIDTTTLSPQSLKCVVAAAASYWATNKVNAQTVIVIRVYVYFPTSLPSSSMQFIIGDGTDGTFGNIRYNSATGNFEAGNSSAWTAGSAAAANTLYRFDVRMTWSSTTHTIDWSINGTPQTQWTLGGQVDSSFATFRLGSQTSSTGTVLFQHLVVTGTSGDYPLGAGGTQTLKPNADGTHNAGTNVMEDNAGTDIGATTAYDKLNSIPPDATTYVRQVATGANYAEVAFEDISDTHSAIIGAMAYLAYTSATTTANRGACIISKDAFSSQTEVHGNDVTTADYSDGSTANLFFKSAIVSGVTDDTTVNALKARIGYSGDVSPNPYWVDLWVEVAYSTSAGAAPKVQRLPLLGVG